MKNGIQLSRVIVVLMLSIGTASCATWSSAFGNQTLHYDERHWTKVTEFHVSGDVFVALMDHSDGSAFMLRIESMEGLAQTPDAAPEASLAETLADSKFRTRIIGRSEQKVADLRFKSVEYRVKNSKFGMQRVRHSYARGEDGDEATILMFTWPLELPLQEGNLPAKHMTLLQGLSL